MGTLQFHLSPEASRKVTEFAEANKLPSSSPLRIDIVGGAESGYAYDFYFDSARATDFVVETGGHRLLISPDAAAYLDGSTLDWVTTDNGSGFYIDNPNEPDKT
jgi:iron-sulfur cluster assembly protein